MKKGKKIVIGVAAVAVVAGGFYAVSGGSRGEAQLPQVSVTKAETGDVEEIVDATGTVVSDEQKTFYSPVNAQIKKVSFAEGDSVSKGTKLVEFELKDLERDNQKAELNVKSGEYDYNCSCDPVGNPVSSKAQQMGRLSDKIFKLYRQFHAEFFCCHGPDVFSVHQAGRFTGSHKYRSRTEYYSANTDTSNLHGCKIYQTGACHGSGRTE